LGIGGVGGFFGCDDVFLGSLAVLIALMVRVIGMTTLSIHFTAALTVSMFIVTCGFPPTGGCGNGGRVGIPLGRRPTT